jgi:hypothetical protein
MKTIRYKSWNWEYDKGEDTNPPIMNSSDNADNYYAEAYYDGRGYLFRVKEFTSNDCSIYEYFCNDDGKIIEKRSLDDNGNVYVTVRYKYDENIKEIHETAWYPESNQVSYSKRKYE